MDVEDAMQQGRRSADYVPLPSSSDVGKQTKWQRWKAYWLRMDKLIYWTLLGVIVGLIVGLGFYGRSISPIAITLIGYPGELLIRALQELILPLIVFALMVGVLNLRHTPGGAGRIVRWALSYYMLSMLLAVASGIVLVQLIKPGTQTTFSANNATSCSSADPNSIVGAEDKANKSVVNSLLDIGRDLLPTNIVAAAGLPNYLGIIMFAVVFAVALGRVGERAEPIIQTIEVCNTVILQIIRSVIVFTPIGVASLIASTILGACDLGGLVKALGLYVGTILCGFAFHGVVTLPSLMMVLSRRNPIRAFRGFLPALVMGMGTASSAATMPLTMQNAEENVGCNRGIVQFIVPLGTNINRDGAALYEAVSVLFILQANGVPITSGIIAVVVITATLAAIGSASVPNSALVTMITVLQALNYTQFIPDVALLYSVDWFLGMLRTSLNIWGDATGLVIVDSWATKQREKEERLPTSTSASSSSSLPRKEL